MTAKWRFRTRGVAKTSHVMWGTRYEKRTRNGDSIREGSRNHGFNDFLIEKVKKRMFPKVSDPCETSSKKSKKHRAAATRHFVREGCKSEKKMGDSRREGCKFEKSDATKVWEGCPGMIVACGVIEVKRRCDFGNLRFAETTEGLVRESLSFIDVKR